MHFVEKFDINLKFGICKVLSGPELAKVLYDASTCVLQALPHAGGLD
jgi:hypothetical protein